ncbi:FAD-dependent oxidoreductase [Pseudarthrobacter sp. J75]|uniref:L-aspartate oxidase n=1 Tax=unclassified Pseudarthrobacter TaxID=2647000 RepID=UPI002E81A010|nr:MULTISPECIES: FAD-dependent oxidoreductase [unclassified Pseudarthrobacter]MEE2521514.1 FAD-dependent oxidoreductase [Pseudarthrobacter sp. J47]MEE2528746.1 FAD-dependent oxidoreductase [Pseudarthrobacter sp. J75]
MSGQRTQAGIGGRGGTGGKAPRLIVVGSGIAGLYSALLAAEGGAEVVLLSKGALADSNTYFAQGGISAVLDRPAPGDTVGAHIADTLKAGGGHCNEEAVRVLCTEARHDIAGLQRFGVAFDVDNDGDPALGLEAAHSAPRILHAGGDATGAGVARALIRSVLDAQAAGRIQVFGHAHATSLSVLGGRVTGVNFIHDGRELHCHGDAVLLATGGAGRLFAKTTNPSVATADGLALAWRAGANLADLEFFQFHPTSMVIAEEARETAGTEPLLISEAVRGEGAILVDAHGNRFMPAYHPDAELAPRDVVSRSIALHLAAQGDPTGHVFLDARVLEERHGQGFLASRFPTITARTREAGVDWTRELVPVAPAAHYWMGGVATDLYGRTSLPGLLAAGEVACTGVQGANRLASNSLLEGLVFGRRAVEGFLASVAFGSVVAGSAVSSAPALDSRAGIPLAGSGACTDSYATTALPESAEPIGERTGLPGSADPSGAEPEPFSRDALRALMTAKAGVIRDGALLREAAGALGVWADVVSPQNVPDSLDPRVHEDANLLVAARLLVHAARKRRTSLGAHYRSDSREEPASVLPAVDDLDQRYTTSRKVSLAR